MEKTNPQIRQEALATLKGRWAVAILMPFIYYVISGVAVCIPALQAVSFVVTIPLSYGLTVWFLQYLRSEDRSAPPIDRLFDGFKDYVRIFITMFLVGIYTFLWGLLLIVPGIVKMCSYSMTSYILYDYPELQNNAAIELSMAMMEGKKMKLFLMTLNFLMWALLSIFTLGIALFWVLPYIQTTTAVFYEDVKQDYLSRNPAPIV